MEIDNDPQPRPLPDDILAKDGPYVVGLHQGGDFVLLDPDGVAFEWDHKLGDLDFAARFRRESDAMDAASERGMTLFRVVEKAGAIELRVVD